MARCSVGNAKDAIVPANARYRTNFSEAPMPKVLSAHGAHFDCVEDFEHDAEVNKRSEGISRSEPRVMCRTLDY
jgi:hypothetical protein